MKKIEKALHTLLILYLAGPALATIQVHIAGGPYQVNPGGEFTATVLVSDNAALPVGYVFQTFCLERSEYLSLGGTYYAVLNTAAVEGGAGSGSQDPLDPKTAWLYHQFDAGILSNYEYADLTGRRNSAQALQNAVWRLEGEQGMPAPGSAAANFINADALAGWSNIAPFVTLYVPGH